MRVLHRDLVAGGKWAQEEDDLLMKIVNECGAKNWKKVVICCCPISAAAAVAAITMEVG